MTELLRVTTGSRRWPTSRVKDQLLETRLFQHRALVAVAVVILTLLTLLGRLAYLQIIGHDHFTTLSEHNRVRLQPLPPTRGLIFDRNGELLAENLPAYRLEIIPEQTDGVEATLQRLRTLIELSDEDIQRFKKLRPRTAPYSRIPLRFRLQEEEVNHLAVELHRYPGVHIQAGLIRHYPMRQHGVHIVGYVGRIDEQELQRIDTSAYRGTSHIGKTGVEKTYESRLHGQVGYQQVETNVHGRVLRILHRQPPAPGQNIYLTVDMRLQKAAEQALGDYNGVIVAMDPRNGEILALVSLPGYDPNLFVNGIDVASYRALSTSVDRPLFNRAVQGTYPPGSTIKPFLGLAGLEYSVTHPGKRLYCPGYFQIPGHARKYRDWRKSGHGQTNISKAVTQSCDVYFYDLAMNMGIDRMHDYLSQFGLGRRTGIDLGSEHSGNLPSRAWKRAKQNEMWYTGDTIAVGIGQGLLTTTPLQLAHATATLAQDGRPFKPRLLRALQDQGSSQIELQAAQPLQPVAIQNPLHWRYILRSMIQVVHGKRGTARRIAEDLDYTIAGKTGTAQVFSLKEDETYNADELDKKFHDHALFIAFAPADAPLIALAVIVEHGGSGGGIAAPIARQVLDAYLLDQLRIESPFQTAAYRVDR